MGPGRDRCAREGGAHDAAEAFHHETESRTCLRRDEWDLGATGVPARVALTAARAAWAARQKAADLSEDGGGLLDRLDRRDDGMDIQG